MAANTDGAWLGPSDLADLLQSIEAELRHFVIVAAETGCRRGEMLTLLWEDIDLESGTIAVRRHRTRPSRRVPLSKRAKVVMEDWSANRAPFRPARRAPVFPSCRQDQGDRVAEAFRRAAREAGLDLTLDDLRDAYAGGLVRDGVPTPTVDRLLGRTPPPVRDDPASHFPPRRMRF